MDGYLNLSLGDNTLFGAGFAGSGVLGDSHDFAKFGGTTSGTFRLHDKTIVHETGHCFGLHHSDLISNVMTTTSPITTEQFTQFTEEQKSTMQTSIRTSTVHNKWHQYLSITNSFNSLEDKVYLGYSSEVSFDFQTTDSNYPDNIEVTSWSVSPNLNIINENGNSMTLRSKGCHGSGWINANISIGNCYDVSICKEVSIGFIPSMGIIPAVNYFTYYSCGSEIPECLSHGNTSNDPCACAPHY